MNTNVFPQSLKSLGAGETPKTFVCPKGFDEARVLACKETGCAKIAECVRYKLRLEKDRLTREVTPDEIADVYSLIIKGDRANLLIVFFNDLNTYTDDGAGNVIFQGESSGGKS